MSHENTKATKQNDQGASPSQGVCSEVEPPRLQDSKQRRFSGFARGRVCRSGVCRSGRVPETFTADGDRRAEIRSGFAVRRGRSGRAVGACAVRACGVRACAVRACGVRACVVRAWAVWRVPFVRALRGKAAKTPRSPSRGDRRDVWGSRVPFASVPFSRVRFVRVCGSCACPGFSPGTRPDHHTCEGRSPNQFCSASWPWCLRGSLRRAHVRWAKPETTSAWRSWRLGGSHSGARTLMHGALVLASLTPAARPCPRAAALPPVRRRPRDAAT